MTRPRIRTAVVILFVRDSLAFMLMVRDDDGEVNAIVNILTENHEPAANKMESRKGVYARLPGLPVYVARLTSTKELYPGGVHKILTDPNKLLKPWCGTQKH